MSLSLQTILDEKTLVSLGSAAVVLSPIGGGFIWLQSKLSKIDQRLRSIETEGRETWSFSQMEAWALRLGKMNPTVNVPDPEKPFRSRIEDT